MKGAPTGPALVRDLGTLDFGYAHLFIKDASINQANPTPPPGNGQLVGTYKGSVDILGVQFAYRF